MDEIERKKWERIYKIIPDVDKVMEYTGKDEVVSSYDAKKHYEKKAPPAFIINTGFSSLDRMTQGFRNGELISVTGITKQGKTVLCQSITQNLSNQNIHALWFSYEVPPLQFINKFQVTPLFYLPLKNVESNLKWVEKRIQEGIVKYDTKVIFIDHLHYLVPLSANVRMDLMIGATMRELKKMALKYNIIIFIIVHTKKLAYDKKPDLDSIRDSSLIAQESDFVMAIWRRIEQMKGSDELIFTNEAKLFLLANRWNGYLGVLDLRHSCNMFTEIEKEKYDE